MLLVCYCQTRLKFILKMNLLGEYFFCIVVWQTFDKIDSELIKDLYLRKTKQKRISLEKQNGFGQEKFGDFWEGKIAIWLFIRETSQRLLEPVRIVPLLMMDAFRFIDGHSQDFTK